ncbi:MAG: hypothetical protein NT090_04565 [Acidobacteria bacterium]|nr:hypothetical protein [Acidobacteriota bacterium]
MGFGLGWYDPWYYWAGYSPAYYDYGYYGDPYYGYDPYAYDPYAYDPYAYDPYAHDPYAYDPYGYYPTPVPAAAGVVMHSRVRPAYVRGPVRRAYAPARVLVVGDGRWHRFGER